MTSHAGFARTIRAAGFLILACLFLRPAPAVADWYALGPGTDGPVEALAIDTGVGAVFAGGDFATAGGIETGHVAAWRVDPPGWESLGGGVDGPVYALAWDGERHLYVGGDFTGALQPGGAGLAVHNIARWDMVEEEWSALDLGLDGAVYALEYDAAGDKVYAGGAFTGVAGGGTPLARVAAWDISAGEWSALGDGVNGVVQALASGGGRVYAGGRFTAAAGLDETEYIAAWNPAAGAWEALAPGLNGFVYALAFDGAGGGTLYAGGNFGGLSGGGADLVRVAAWSVPTGEWRALGRGLNAIVRALAFDAAGKHLYAGGDFRTDGLLELNRVARYDTLEEQWQRLGPGVNGPARTLAFEPVNGLLFTGGLFSRAGGVNADHVAFDDFGEYRAFPASSSSCFIASAVFGDPGHESVSALRDFRDRYLLSSRPGRALARFYYRRSPAPAAWLSARPRAAAVVRVFLAPFARAARLLCP